MNEQSEKKENRAGLAGTIAIGGGKDCETSAKNAKAGCSGLAAEAVADHASNSWDLID